MKKNSSGKVMTIFMVIFAILLVSTTAIAVFLFQKETERRKEAETLLAQLQASQSAMEKELKTAKDQLVIFEAKNKEADEKINSLLDEVELEKGLREEMKNEVKTLRESVGAEAKVKEELAHGLTVKLDESQRRVQELESQLASAAGRTQELDALTLKLQERVSQLESGSPQIELGKIVVSPTGSTKSPKEEGRVLTVDAENQFVIVNLGQKDGISEGSTLSIFRDQEYVGDIKVTRVQPDMSAADFIPPLASQNISKNDRVVRKQ